MNGATDEELEEADRWRKGSCLPGSSGTSPDQGRGEGPVLEGPGARPGAPDAGGGRLVRSCGRPAVTSRARAARGPAPAGRTSDSMSVKPASSRGVVRTDPSFFVPTLGTRCGKCPPLSCSHSSAYATVPATGEAAHPGPPMRNPRNTPDRGGAQAVLVLRPGAVVKPLYSSAASTVDLMPSNASRSPSSTRSPSVRWVWSSTVSWDVPASSPGATCSLPR